MNLSPQLAELAEMLKAIRDAAVDAAGLADDADPGTARRGFATLAASIGRAQHHLDFLIHLAEGNDHAN
jgi:hypothetical protein